MTDEEMKELQKLREELKEAKEKYEKELKKKSLSRKICYLEGIEKAQVSKDLSHNCSR